MRGNTITITMPLKRGKLSKTDKLFQYDYGQKLIFTGMELPTYYEVHFSNEMHGTAVTSIGDETGVDIPDALLETGDTIYLWLFLHDDVTDGETEFQGAIPVIKRAHVDDQITPAQRSVVEQAVIALNTVPEIAKQEAVEAAEEAAAEKVADAEAWAVGQRDGVDVPDTDETYHNNSKYYAEQTEELLEDLSGQIREDVENWLDDHPEATTTVDFAIATKVFPTVAAMIADTSLKNGDNVATRNYYAAGDNGGNNYVISSSHTGTFYLTLNNGLYANLLTEKGYIRAESIGIKAYASATNTPDSEDMDRNVALLETAIHSNVYLIFGKGHFYFSDTVKTSMRGTYHLKGVERSASTLHFPNSDGITFYTTDYYNYWWFENFGIVSYGDCIKVAENVANLVDCGFEHLILTSENGSCFVAPSYNVSKYTAQGGGYTVYDTAVQNCVFNYINGQANNGAVFKNIMGMGNQYRHINIIGSTLYGFWNCDGRVEDVNTLGTGIQFMFYYNQAYSHSLLLYLIRVNAEGVRGGFIYSEEEVALQPGEDSKKPTTAHQMTLSFLYAWQSGMSLHGSITENHDIYPVTVNVINSAVLINSRSIFNPSAYPSKYDVSKVKANMWSRRASSLSLNNIYVGHDINYIVGPSGGSGTGLIYSAESIYKRRVIGTDLSPGYTPPGTEIVPGFDKLSTKFLIGGKNVQVYNETLASGSNYLEYTNNFDARGADVLVLKNESSNGKEVTGINIQVNCSGKVYTIENSSSSSGSISLAHKYASSNNYFFFDDQKNKVLEPGQSIQIVLDKIKINNTYYRMWTEVSGDRSKTVAITGSTPVIVGEKGTRYMCGTVTSLEISPPANGVIEVYFTSGSTAAEVKMPRTVKIPSWFDPNDLDTDTNYKIRITDGTYGEVTTFVEQPYVNLLDPSTFDDGMVWYNGGKVSGYTNYSATPKIEVTPGKDYILKRNGNVQNTVCYFDEEEAYVSQTVWGTNVTDGVTKTIPDGVHYVGISVWKDDKNDALFAEV